MIPIKVEDKRKRIEAMIAAFIDRFMLGFLIPNLHLGIHPAITGGILGVGLCLPSAIISRAYVPIMSMGIAGGIMIGFITKGVLL